MSSFTIKEIDVDNQLMQEIATYIYENYDKKLTLVDMAERFNISRSYLSKKFKVITGFGFKEYVVNVRINIPKENSGFAPNNKMILNNDKLKSIAFTCKNENLYNKIKNFLLREIEIKYIGCIGYSDDRRR